MDIDKTQSATVKVRSPRKFEWLFSIRAEATKDLFEKMAIMEEHWMDAEWEPIPQGYPSPSRMSNKAPESSGATKMCQEHNIPMLERISKKTGKPYFSHSQKDESGNWQACFGQGFK